MNETRKSIRRIFWVFFLIFLSVIIYIIKIEAVDRDKIISNTYNPRLSITDESVKRGSILDAGGNVLAESVLTDLGYAREYPMGTCAAHVVGYVGVGKTGMEAAAGFKLTNIHNEFLQRIRNAFFEEEIEADSLVLTIDSGATKKARELLGGNKGAVVMMEPRTGRVVAMASSPDFDPNTAAEKRGDLKDREDSPLLNRAVSGYYTPGSTFKLVTALAAMRNMENWQDYTYECTGEETFQEKTIHCAGNKAHGTVDMADAVRVSCNCYFAKIGTMIGAGALRQTAESLKFNSTLPFLLGDSISSVTLDAGSSESKLVETSFGQGETLVTPLYMAALASAIANDGVMMEPYIVSHEEYYNGKTGNYTIPKTLGRVMTKVEADKLTDMMAGVVENGTGSSAALWGYQVAGKTGTAENPKGSAHLWFMGFVMKDGEPLYSVAVVIENPEGWANASWVAGQLFAYVCE